MLIDFLQPLQEAANDSQALIDWLATLGQVEAVSGSPALGTIIQNGAVIGQQLQALDPSTLDSWSGIRQILTLGRETSNILQQLRQFASDPSRAQVAEGLGEDILSLLLASYLRRKQPIAFRVASLLTLIQAREYAVPDAGVVVSGVTLRYPRVVDQFRFDVIGNLLSKPGQTLSAAYFPNDLATGIDAYNGAQQFFNALSFLMQELGAVSNTTFPPSSESAASTETGVDPPDDQFYSDADWGSTDAPLSTAPPLPPEYYAGMFPTFRVDILGSRSSGADAGIDVIASSALHPGGVAGYLLMPTGAFNSIVTMGDWRLTLSANGAIPAFVAKSTGVDLAPSGLPVDGGSAKVLLELVPASGSTQPALVVGSTTGTRLELGSVSFEGDLFFDPSRKAASVSAKAAKSSFVISGGDGDGFVSSVLPEDGMKAVFDAGVEWSSDQGLSFIGGAGLDATLPIGLSIGGVVEISSVRLTLLAGASGVQFQLSASIGVAIGPVQATVSGLGIAANVTFPNDGGNLGVADLALSFKPPSGVGLAIDSAGLVGGGFLDYDPTDAQYAGMLQLAYQQFQLQAFGLITTKLPTGPGYSLVAMIDATFPPIELVAGFTLNGIGGLLGIHRTVSTDALEAALKAHTLSNFLFAKNPIANAPQLLTDLATFFPAASGSYVFGPLLQIGWGTPTVLTINLALLLTLPDPVRLVLLGELDVLLPDPQAVELEMHMDILGSIDFTADEGSLDAVLHDSRLAHYPLAGAMALRACWAGSSKEFLMSIGGFNPAFQPPPNFPTLPPVSLNMKSGSIAKLNLAGYLAVTSNTLQIGAKIDLAAGVDGFGISGYLNFDTLIQFHPFHFEADISGGVELTAGGDDLMSLDLSGSMSGPSPWHVAGKVHFSVMGFGVSKSFSETFGDSTTEPALQPVDVGAQLRAALGDPRNYSASLTTNQNGLVSLRTPTTTGIALGHPAASLNIDQKIVPLGLTIAKFGAAPPQGDTLFTITATTVDGNSAATVPLNDEFAPAQFLDLTDDQEISSPSFESFNAGVTVAQGTWTVGEAVAGSAVMQRDVQYETFLIDTAGGQPREITGTTPVPPNRLVAILSALLNSGTLRYAAPSQPMLQPPLGYVVATTDQIAVSSVGVAAGQTYAQARGALAAAVAQNPSQLGALQVVPLYEVPS